MDQAEATTAVVTELPTAHDHPYVGEGSLGMSMTMVAARLSEVVAVLAAGLYSLGVLRTSGELRELHLSTPTVLAGFSQHDVLMKGVGVLVSHMTSTFLLAGLLAMFAAPQALAAMNRFITREYIPTRMESFTIFATVTALLLASRFWEGMIFTLLVFGVIGSRYRNRRAIGRGLALALIVMGMIFIGLMGSFLHAPPLMTITAKVQGHDDKGFLVGSGDEGQWYIAIPKGHGVYDMEVAGGSNGEKVEDVAIHPANDDDYRTVAFVIVDALRGR